MEPLYEQDLSLCLQTPERSRLFEAYLHKATTPLAALRTQHQQQDLALGRLLKTEDHTQKALQDWGALTRKWMGAPPHHLLLVGMGGAILGAKALFGAQPTPTQVDFLEDPDSLPLILERCDPEAVRILCVSKSGDTIETLMQACLLFEWCADPSKQCLVITAPHQNPLRQLAQSAGVQVVPHDPDLSGRYSVFSAAALVPALAMGLSVPELCQAAGETLDSFLAKAPQDVAPACGAALLAALIQEEGLQATALMAYGHELQGLAAWYRQLICESLGKNGQGLSCLAGPAPADQHSVLQLYLEGPRDKLVTVIPTQTPPGQERIHPTWAQAVGMDFLAHRTLADLTVAQQKATVHTLAHSGCAVRCLRPRHKGPRALAALMMHFMVETVLLGSLLGVDPYTNPGVDAGKTLALTTLRSTS